MPATLYEPDCYATKGKDERQLHTAEIRIMRGMCGLKRFKKS